MNDASHWNHLPKTGASAAGGIDETFSGVTGTSRVYGPPATVRRLLQRVRDAGVLRCHDHRKAVDGASDREVQRLAGPLGRLNVEDARWDVIGAAHGGKRRRI